jgi:hypothetical protein
MTPLVLFHQNCLDGQAAAAITARAIERDHEKGVELGYGHLSGDLNSAVIAEKWGTLW